MSLPVRARLATLVALGAAAGCAKQDPALLVTFRGGWQFPQNADTLTVDVSDGAQVILHRSYALSQATPLPLTLTVVQSGGAHPRVHLHAELVLSGSPRGAADADAAFASGQTVPVDLTLVPTR